jgi:hypothetical protein
MSQGEIRVSCLVTTVSLGRGYKRERQGEGDDKGGDGEAIETQTYVLKSE